MSNSFFIFTRSELIFITVIFILGLITGATILNLYSGRIIDGLILNKNELKAQVEEQTSQINQLEENLNKFKHHTITKISVELDTDVNKHTQQMLKDKIKAILSGIIGKEVNKIDPLLLRDIIHERYLMVEGNTYQLYLIYLVIGEELTLYIKISKLKNKNEAE